MQIPDEALIAALMMKGGRQRYVDLMVSFLTLEPMVSVLRGQGYSDGDLVRLASRMEERDGNDRTTAGPASPSDS